MFAPKFSPSPARFDIRSRPESRSADEDRPKVDTFKISDQYLVGISTLPDIGIVAGKEFPPREPGGWPSRIPRDLLHRPKRYGIKGLRTPGDIGKGIG